MYFVYIIISEKDIITYTGYSNNVKRRLAEHNSGRVNATKYRRPFKVLFTEECEDLQKVKQRELYWKSGGGRRKLKQFLK